MAMALARPLRRARPRAWALPFETAPPWRPRGGFVSVGRGLSSSSGSSGAASGDGGAAGGADGDGERQGEQHGGGQRSAPAGPGKPLGRTFYDILEIGRRAKPDEIKAAYRKLAKRYHPDRNDGDAEAETKFKEVLEAYGTLSEPFKRALYDQDLQFSAYGTRATQEVEREKWTEHWDRETPEEREARKERYKRYAAGERNDLPPAPFKVNLTPLYMLGTIGGIFYVCVRAPDWFDAQSDPTFCDPAHDDTSVPLVRAFYDPVMDRWERLPEDVDPPTPQELYAHYRRSKPQLLEQLDVRLLPKVRLTTHRVPKTEAALASFRPLHAQARLHAASE